MKKIFIIIIGFLLFLGVYSKINKESYTGVMDKNENIVTDFKINRGDGSTEVGKNLAKNNFIKSKYYFWYYVWRTKTDTKLQAGTYSIAKNMTIPQMVNKFSQGKVKPEIIKLTIPEGLNNDKIINLVKEKKPEIAREFQKLVKCNCLNEVNCACDKFSRKYDFIQKIPQGLDLEGYLFPDTYFIAKKETGASLVSKFLNNFNKKVNGDVKSKIVKQKKSLEEILSLASIVEREVKLNKDRPIIAGIFWKRLEIGMPLGSDATLSYILKTNKIKYDSKDLEIDSPYNTYKNVGLPPGPICNPGLEAILATIHPIKTDYLYFLNDADTGETIFSKTNDEHNVNKMKHGL
jgi:UPF0755 protein